MIFNKRTITKMGTSVPTTLSILFDEPQNKIIEVYEALFSDTDNQKLFYSDILGEFKICWAESFAIQALLMQRNIPIMSLPFPFTNMIDSRTEDKVYVLEFPSLLKENLLTMALGHVTDNQFIIIDPYENTGNKYYISTMQERKDDLAVYHNPLRVVFSTYKSNVELWRKEYTSLTDTEKEELYKVENVYKTFNYPLYNETVHGGK